MQDHSYKGTDVIGFLEQLLAEIPGKLLVIWDGAPAGLIVVYHWTWS